MSTHTTGTVRVTSWTEQTWDGRPHDAVAGPKRTTAVVTLVYRGGLEATSTVHHLMAYLPDGTVHTTSLEHVTGSLEGRAGEFVLRHTGTFANGVAESTFAVVAGSATGELAGLTATGGTTFPAGEGTYTLTTS
jgi:hypothetical protein